MSKNKKILIGILSCLPLLLTGFYIYQVIVFFWNFIKEANQVGRPEDFIFGDIMQMAGIGLSALLLGILSLGVLIYFIIQVINNTQINSDERIIWILVFIFLGMFTFPLYWYLRIWKEPTVPLQN
ncbi:MAG: hypothetical protein ACKVOW_14680 [Chitinophagaceae bacterium]